MAPRVTFCQNTGRPQHKVTTDTAEIARFFTEHSGGPNAVKFIPPRNRASWPRRSSGRAPRMATNNRPRGSRRSTARARSPGSSDDPDPFDLQLTGRADELAAELKAASDALLASWRAERARPEQLSIEGLAV
jgi:hypothetical protein